MDTGVSGHDTALRERPRRRVCLSHARDADALGQRLSVDLAARGCAPGSELAASDALVAILSPGAVGADQFLAELSRARFGAPAIPIVPVMAITCAVPLIVFRLHCVDMRDWTGRGYETALGQLMNGIDGVTAAAAG